MKKIPILRKGKVHEVRRESNTEIMHDSLRKIGAIRLRVALQIRDSKGNYYGFQGGSVIRDVASIEAAREFEAKLRKFVEGG